MKHAVAAPKPPAWRRWIAIVLRCVHLAGLVLLGAALLGAPLAVRDGALLTLASGLALFVAELADTRIRLGELAGLVVLLKLAAVGCMALLPATAPRLFWLVLAVSGLVAHAPRPLRHWRPGRGGTGPR
jgi:hypothetical protein